MHPINPATGLPIIGDDDYGVDVGGHPYGTGWNSSLPWSAPSWDIGTSGL